MLTLKKHALYTQRCIYSIDSLHALYKQFAIFMVQFVTIMYTNCTCTLVSTVADLCEDIYS